MLKLIHVQARLVVSEGQAVAKQMSASEADDRTRAQEVIAIFRQALGEGLTRLRLEARLSEYTGTRLDYREIDGLAKVISDSFATFEIDTKLLVPKTLAEEVCPPEADEPDEILDSLLNAPTTGTSPDEDKDAPLYSDLTAWRLAVWREAARPDVYPFNNSGLTVALKPGVQSLRRVAAAHDEELLARLMPRQTQTYILNRAAENAGYTLVAPPPPGKLGDLLFADTTGRHRLVGLSDELNVENLLNRYNVELLRGVLYLAPRLRIVVRDRYKDLFKYIKFFGLMHEVRPLSDKAGREASTPLAENEISGYEIVLEGAASPFLARTDRRYGIQFARFLPALLLCEAQWELEAELVFGPAYPAKGGKAPPTYKASYQLGPQPHLRTHFKGSGEFDSLLEQSLAAAFEKRFKMTTRRLAQTEVEPELTADVVLEDGGKKKKAPKKKKPKGEDRQGWTILREDRIIPVFDTVMIPDFAFEHKDGRRALLEIVGFWEPGYLERKIAKLNRAGRRDLIVLVSERTRCGREHFRLKDREPDYPLIFFKGTPRLGPLMETIERCAVKEVVSPEPSDGS